MTDANLGFIQENITCATGATAQCATSGCSSRKGSCYFCLIKRWRKTKWTYLLLNYTARWFVLQMDGVEVMLPMTILICAQLKQLCACESVEVSMAEDKLDSFETAGGKVCCCQWVCSSLLHTKRREKKYTEAQMTMIKSNLMVMMIWSNYDEFELLGCCCRVSRWLLKSCRHRLGRRGKKTVRLAVANTAHQEIASAWRQWQWMDMQIFASRSQ